MKKRYVLYGHTISLLNKIIWLILDALMRKNAVKLPTTQKNIPKAAMHFTPMNWPMDKGSPYSFYPPIKAITLFEKGKNGDHPFLPFIFGDILRCLLFGCAIITRQKHSMNSHSGIIKIINTS